MILEKLGHVREFGLCRGMKASEVISKFPNASYENENLVYVGDAAIIIENDIIYHIAIYPNNTKYTNIFGIRVSTGNLDVLSIISFFIKSGIDFRVNYRFQQDGSITIITEYRDEYIFELKNGIYCVEKIFCIIL